MYIICIFPRACIFLCEHRNATIVFFYAAALSFFFESPAAVPSTRPLPESQRTKVSFCSLTGYGTAKIHFAVSTPHPLFPFFSSLSLSPLFPFSTAFFISMRFFRSYHLAATFLSKDFLLAHFSRSLLSLFEGRSSAISSFLARLCE